MLNPTAFVRCRRCRRQFDLAAGLGCCPGCANAGERGVLEVGYDLERANFGAPELGRRGRSIWQFAALLPAGDVEQCGSLGEGDTPLLPSRSVGPAAGMGRLFLKNETTNPTWSHKDRFHAVSTAMAGALGYRAVVASSTGNHGASMAAYAARAGLAPLVLCPPQVSSALLGLIQLYGATVVVTDWDARDAMGRRLVEAHGWYPATGLDPSFAFAPNPFGTEGHKTIAFELIRDLGGPPDSVWVPCAGGDTLFGIWKGFCELRDLGLIDRVPRMYGCQPEGADALGQTLAAGAPESVVLADPDSVATSVRERSVGMPAVEAVRESGGGAPTATDQEILAAMRDLGREGLCVEPASALPVACARECAEAGEIDPDEVAVCLLTASGVKWPDALAQDADPIRIGPTIQELEQRLSRLALL